MKDSWDLPWSWCWTSAGEIAEVVGGGTPATNDPANFGGGIPWITPADLSNHKQKFIAGGARTISAQGLDGSGARLLPVGAVLFSSRAPIGYVAIASKAVTTNQGFKSFVPFGNISSDYLYYWLTASKQRAEALASGTTFLELSGAKAALLPVPLAPIGEQTRIVEKLEELLSDLDAGVAELKAAQKKLAQYRQSLLKAAVSGALTAAWREQHTPTESGAELLQRILRQRRARWEARQLSRFEEQGKTPPKEWQAKYPEPVAPDTAGLPELPEGWVWASVDCVLSEIGTGKSFKCEERPPSQSEIGVVKVSAVSWGEYDERESKTCTDPERLNEALYIREGDFLFSRANTIELVGACVIAKSVTLQVMLSDKILRFVFVMDDLKSWLLHFLRSELGRSQIELLASGNQESMRNIGQERIRQIALPLPPLSEMAKILDLLEQQLEASKDQTASIVVGLKQAAAQRKNLLKAAFSGQLVPQDPRDEPASVLLERIRAARTAQGATKKTRGRKVKELA